MSHLALDGLFETYVNVRHLPRSLAFYSEVVGLELAYQQADPPVAFLWIGGRGQSMLGLWGTGTAPNHMRLHLAFRTTVDDVLVAPRQLREHGVTPLGFDGEEVDEPVVIGWMPAISVFFTDPDGHLLEYLAMLDEPARPTVGVVSYEKWTFGGPA